MLIKLFKRTLSIAVDFFYCVIEFEQNCLVDDGIIYLE